MGNWLSNVVKTLGPRAVGVAVTAVAGWIYGHSKGTVVVDTDTAAKMITGAIAVYAATHRAASSVINPGDAAKGSLADAEKVATDLGATVRVDK